MVETCEEFVSRLLLVFDSLNFYLSIFVCFLFLLFASLLLLYVCILIYGFTFF